MADAAGEEGKKEGPSKNELKKLAKKAEKAAKKQAAQGGGGGGSAPPPAAAGAAGGGGQQQSKQQQQQKPAEVATTPAPKLLLYNGKEGCLATLKAIYASQHFNVPLSAAKKKDLPSGYDNDNEKLLNNKPLLIYGNDIVLGGGGNAMCKAISFMGNESSYSFEADEWCEIERAARGSSLDITKLASALEESSTGIHLVGESDTIADICIIVTLSSVVDALATWPVQVQIYYKAHQAALDRAKDAVPEFLQSAHGNFDDPSISKVVTSVFVDALETVCPGVELPETIVKECQNPKHGDYQCSGAMPAFSYMKKNGTLPDTIKAPTQLGQAIIDNIGDSHPVVTGLTLQGPGFVLCRLSKSYLQKQAQKLVGGTLPKPAVSQQQCVVDFSSPNIAKEMHVGHLRSTIIGEAVCRVLEFCGHKVERVNHVGDWGTQFGMLIQFLKEEYPDFASSMPNITDLTGFYKAAKAKFDIDADFKKTSQLNVVALQSGNEECMKIWKILCDVSRGEFKKVYDRLDVTVHECGESFYNDKIPAVIEEFESAGMISVEEGGAKCVFLDGFKIPLMLQKSDGGYGYDSTDMAALKYRLHEIKADRVIVITDFSQGDHFAMCNTAAREIGWVNNGQELKHIGFGTVQGEDGKRFKTRSGDTVRLVDLLDESVARMEKSLQDRIADKKANITADEVHDVAEAIGYGAVKYFDLRRNPTSNYKFSYDDMLDTKGNTAVYLLYARVRLESIAAKAKAEHGVDVEELIKDGKEQIIIEHESERKLALQLYGFADMIETTLDDLYPYHICDYVYALSIAASDFVTQCRVLGSDEMKSRLLLCHVTTTIMRQCFELLGIRHVKRI